MLATVPYDGRVHKPATPALISADRPPTSNPTHRPWRLMSRRSPATYQQNMKNTPQTTITPDRWIDISLDPSRKLEVLVDEDLDAESELEREFPLPPIEQTNITEIPNLLKNSTYWLQESVPGNPIWIGTNSGKVKAFNRFGIDVALPELIRQACTRIDGDYVIEGQLLENEFVAADLLVARDVNVEHEAYSQRYGKLRHLCRKLGNDRVRIRRTAILPWTKNALSDQLRSNGHRSVIFREIHARYSLDPARPGEVLQYFFVPHEADQSERGPATFWRWIFSSGYKVLVDISNSPKWRWLARVSSRPWRN